ncbi:MAG: glutathione S-transferase family protein [Gammaproteobacteria bacterium]
MKLYYSKNLNPRVAVAVARYLGSNLEYIPASPRAPGAEPAFRMINPNTLVPVLVEQDRTLWETDAIACRLSALASSDFWRTDEGEAEMIQWISWSTHHLTKAAGIAYWWNVIVPTFSTERPSPSVIEDALRDFRHSAAILNSTLTGRQWLVGGAVSYADFRVATSLPFAAKAGLPILEFPEIRRWHDQLWEIDAWRAPFDGLN